MAIGYLAEMAAQGYTSESIGSFHLTMVPYLLRLFKVGTSELIVDVGAAQGHVAISMRRAGFTNVHAIDIETVNFDYFSSQHQISCHRCDVGRESLPFRAKEVKAILSFHLIEHLARGDHFAAEIYRTLAPGGSVALVTPDWRKQYKTFWRDPTHVHPYDKVSLPRLLRGIGFVDLKTYSWGSKYGLGRLELYTRFPRLALIGNDMLITARKPVQSENHSTSGSDDCNSLL